jgi:hypothetical protein
MCRCCRDSYTCTQRHIDSIECTEDLAPSACVNSPRHQAALAGLVHKQRPGRLLLGQHGPQRVLLGEQGPHALLGHDSGVEGGGSPRVQGPLGRVLRRGPDERGVEGPVGLAVVPEVGEGDAQTCTHVNAEYVTVPPAVCPVRSKYAFVYPCPIPQAHTEAYGVESTDGGCRPTLNAIDAGGVRVRHFANWNGLGPPTQHRRLHASR